jgi:hypothetical protein
VQFPRDPGVAVRPNPTKLGSYSKNIDNDAEHSTVRIYERSFCELRIKRLRSRNANHDERLAFRLMKVDGAENLRKFSTRDSGSVT